MQNNSPKILMVAIIACGSLQAFAAQGPQPIPVLCSVGVTDTVNNSQVFVYNQSFTLLPDVPFTESLDDRLKFGDFNARLGVNDVGTQTVFIDYNRDRSVFEFGAFSAQLPLAPGRALQAISGNALSSVVNGTQTNYMSTYSLNCQRLR